MIKNNMQRGFYLMEAIVVMSILISLMSLASRYITHQAEHTINRATAKQLQQVTQAAQQYVRDHYKTFKEGPVKNFQWQNLVDGGYLSDKLVNCNHYQQSYKFNVVEERGLLQVVLITEGGSPIGEQSLRHIAELAGSTAGYASILHPDKIIGHQESWILDGIPLRLGHLASWTIVNEQEVMDAAAFLRRISYPDDKKPNSMETDLKIARDHKIIFENNGLELSHNYLSMTSDNGSFLSISGDGNKYFKIHHPTGEQMHLWSNSFSLHNETSGDDISITNKGWPSIDMLRKKEGYSTKIRPGDITLKDGDKNIYFTAGSVLTSTLPTGGKIVDSGGAFSQLSNQFVKVPYYHTYDGGSDWSDRFYYICNGKIENEGKMFTVGSPSSHSRGLRICLGGRVRIIQDFPN